MRNMANSEGYTSNCEDVQLEMNLHTSRILFFQKDSSHKCQFCTKVRASSRLVSQVWTKYKDKGSHQIIKTSFKKKLKLTKLQICVLKYI